MTSTKAQKEILKLRKALEEVYSQAPIPNPDESQIDQLASLIDSHPGDVESWLKEERMNLNRRLALNGKLRLLIKAKGTARTFMVSKLGIWE